MSLIGHGGGLPPLFGLVLSLGWFLSEDYFGYGKNFIIKNHMKTILKHLWRDKVSLSMLLLTIAFAIVGFAPFMYLLIFFILRGIIWEGQYVESLNKYVTDAKYREILGLDKKKVTPVIELIFQIITVLAVIGAVIYIIINK